MLTSVEVEYSINGGATQTTTVSNLNIEPLANGTLLLGSIIDPSSVEGVYQVNATVTKINTVVDDEADDNSAMAEAIFYDPANAKPRKPLIEMFTSSSCAPCRPGNQTLHSIIDPKDANEYVLIKYQQNFPGNGDPYCTQEAINRRGYYGVNSIPRLEVDGGWDANPAGNFNNNVYNTFKNIPAVGTMSGSYTVDEANQTVSYDVTFTPNFDFPDDAVALQIVIMEKLTKLNVATNGETEFEHVMKKMIGGENGTLLTNVKGGTPVNITGSYTFNGNFRKPNNAGDPIDHATEHSVEEFSDLAVIAYAQYNSNMKVLQAENMQSTTGIKDAESFFGFTSSPNPFQDNVRLNINSLNSAEAKLAVYNTLGQVVYSQDVEIATGTQNISLSLGSLANGIYTIVLDANGVKEQVKVSKF